MSRYTLGLETKIKTWSLTLSRAVGAERPFEVVNAMMEMCEGEGRTDEDWTSATSRGQGRGHKRRDHRPKHVGRVKGI